MRVEGRTGFAICASGIRNGIFTPRYYDPAIEERLEELSSSHNLVSIQELIHSNEVQLRQGKYIDKMHYGSGPVPYIRTSDIANWELRASPKHGVSSVVAAEYRAHADVQEMDVLLVHEGTYLIGTACLLTSYDTDILFQHHLAKLRAQGDRITGPLLMACFLSPIVQRQIRARQFTADVIDSIVGRLPEVKLPLPRSEERADELNRLASEVFVGRAVARVQLAIISRGLDAALTDGKVEELCQLSDAPSDAESGHVSFLGGRTAAESFTVANRKVRGDVLIPRYYDPQARRELQAMEGRCDLVTIGELVDAGTLELQTGDEVGKLSYGGGGVAFVRTSDFGNWELKHDPKQRISLEVYEAYADKQSAKADDILLVRDGTYLVGTTTIIQHDDLPLLFSGGIYRLRLLATESLTSTLLLALLNTEVVRRQMRNIRFTRDIIDTLGHRLREVVLPIPSDAHDRSLISTSTSRLVGQRASLRRQATQLGSLLEEA